MASIASPGLRGFPDNFPTVTHNFWTRTPGGTNRSTALPGSLAPAQGLSGGQEGQGTGAEPFPQPKLLCWEQGGLGAAMAKGGL